MEIVIAFFVLALIVGLIEEICRIVQANLGCIISVVIWVVAIGALGVGGFYSVRWGYNKYQAYREWKTKKAQDEGDIRKKEEQEDKIRAFAMKESPNLWNEYQSLGGAIEVQSKKLENLEAELRSFDTDPDTHSGYIDVRKHLEAMEHAYAEIHSKLQDGYFASLVFDSMPDAPSDTVYRCIREAEQVLERYKELTAERVKLPAPSKSMPQTETKSPPQTETKQPLKSAPPAEKKRNGKRIETKQPELRDQQFTMREDCQSRCQ